MYRQVPCLLLGDRASNGGSLVTTILAWTLFSASQVRYLGSLKGRTQAATSSKLEHGEKCRFMSRYSKQNSSIAPTAEPLSRPRQSFYFGSEQPKLSGGPQVYSDLLRNWLSFIEMHVNLVCISFRAEHKSNCIRGNSSMVAHRSRSIKPQVPIVWRTTRMFSLAKFC